MFCTNCGNKQTSEALFCQFCGTKLPLSSVGSIPQTPRVVESSQEFYTAPVATPTSSSGTGFGAIGLVLGILSTFLALYDFGLVGSGEYSYVMVEEVLLLLAMSIAGTIFSAIGTSRKSGVATAGLIASILGLFLAGLLTTLT